MKPIYHRKRSFDDVSAFLYRFAEVPYTYDKFHYHREFELHYTIKNNGVRYIGDNVEKFKEGDLVLVGPYLPHFWQSDEEYYKGNKALIAQVITLHFNKDFLGDKFIKLPDFKVLRDMLSRAVYGIHFWGSDAELIREKLIQLNSLTGWRRTHSMIEILCRMAESVNYNLLASRGFVEHRDDQEYNKIISIIDYITANHYKSLTLEEVAEKANMNASAFCRYFKKATSKTFSEVLNEIRIGYACKTIIHTNRSISEIGYECGYSSISYFNRVFKQIKKMTPQEFKSKHKENKTVHYGSIQGSTIVASTNLASIADSGTNLTEI